MNGNSKPGVMPIAKIYEAWTAITDNRVYISPQSTIEEGSATVESSDGAKSYDVRWRERGSIFSSTDNATYWRGYTGYPIVAILMIQGRIPFDIRSARLFSNTNWNLLNRQYKRDYNAAIDHASRDLTPQQRETAGQSAMEALNALSKLQIIVSRSLKST